MFASYDNWVSGAKIECGAYWKLEIPEVTDPEEGYAWVSSVLLNEAGIFAKYDPSIKSIYIPSGATSKSDEGDYEIEVYLEDEDGMTATETYSFSIVCPDQFVFEVDEDKPV